MNQWIRSQQNDFVLRANLSAANRVAKTPGETWWKTWGQQTGSWLCLEFSVPARLKNLAGLPPASIAAGAIDLFLDEKSTTRLMLMARSLNCTFMPCAYQRFGLLHRRLEEHRQDIDPNIGYDTAPVN
jgi:hypothetical protein